jgi:hypothetical protein
MYKTWTDPRHTPMLKLSTILTLILFTGCAGRASAPGVPVETVAMSGGSPPMNENGIVVTTSVVGAARGTTEVVTTTVIFGEGMEEPIQDMADEFKSLRAIEGHFGGGDWNDDVDKWMGRKHQLMIELGSRLSAGAYSKSQVIELLAAPDLIAQEGDELYDLIDSLPEFERPASGSYEFLVYYWRGEHDFLYFTAQAETILNSGWWYAGE